MKIEFFLDKTGAVKQEINMKVDNLHWMRFDEISFEIIDAIFNHLLKFDKARGGLFHLTTYAEGGKKEILRQFIHCNWTILNKHLDISERKLSFENIPCPFKSSGNCPYNGVGIVCIKH